MSPVMRQFGLLRFVTSDQNWRELAAVSRLLAFH
jgi:hypothetical protein